MNKTITLEIPESEAANFESAIDNLLNSLRKLDEEHEKRWAHISDMRVETQAMLEQICESLKVG
ncbi:MAG: hypothetical protein AB1757_17355 [Acidobacteriota bacterium]